ncbi:hypothetical protein VC35_15425 [Pseudomonas fluorescens]|uniref:Uncharacterized protein n=1 Tax=Pseudomonas fluorescens TaxID=294 RepID=A0A0F4TNA0_PSEFL|nr:hypothetical protein VC35_15425 [Pseudomonas fluorescens]
MQGLIGAQTYHALDAILDALIIAHITDIEFQLGIGIALANVILLLFVTAEDTNIQQYPYRENV